MKSSRFLAVEVGPDSITLAEFLIHSSGQIELIDWEFSSVDSVSSSGISNDAVLATTLKRLLKCKSFSTRHTGIAIDGHAVFSRLLRLPPVSADKLKGVLQDQAAQHIPYPIEEVVWDCQKIRPEAADSTVLLAAIKTDLVEGVSYAVQTAGLLPDIIDVAPAALANTFRYNYPDVQGSVLLLALSSQSATLVFIEGSRTIFRSLSVPDCLSDRFFQEISRSISFYCTKQQGNVPQCVFVSGTGNKLAAFTTRVSEILHCSVELLNPLKRIPQRPAGCVDESHRLAVVAGLAARKAGPCAIELNLMPESLRKERCIRQQYPGWLACAAGIIILVGIWATGLAVMIKNTEEEVRQVAGRIAKLEKIEAQLHHVEQRIEEQKNRCAVYAEIHTRRNYWLKSLSAVQDMLPDGMFLSATEPIRQEEALVGIRMTVISYLDKESRQGDAVILLRDCLRSDEWFNDQSEIVSRPTKKKFARSFVIDALFEELVLQ